MSELDEQQKKNQSTQDQGPMMSSMDAEPGKATLTSVYGGPLASPKPSGLVGGQDAKDVCSGPNAPLVCAPDAPTPTTVPPQFDVPVSEQCVMPPGAKDWSTTPGVGECPTEPMVGGPSYKAEFAAGNLDTHKSAFNTSWTELQPGFNTVVSLNKAYKLKEKEVIPLLHVDGNVGISAAGQNATNSFDGNKLKEGASKVNSDKVNAKPGLRDQLETAKEKISSSETAMINQRSTVDQALNTYTIKANNIESAANAVELVQIEKEIGDAQLDKEQVKRDVEDLKADAKLAVESAKFAGSLLQAWSNPTKIFDAWNAAASTGGALAERSATQDGNKQLAALDGKIRTLQTKKAGLLGRNAALALKNALGEFLNALIEVQKQAQLLRDKKNDYQAAYRAMGALMAQAGAASGMKEKDQKALKSAVEAVPKIEEIIQQLDGMDAGIAVPKYNEASGIGAAMSTNLSSFTHALSVVKGNKEYIAEQRVLWDGRKASVTATIDSALDVAGTEW